MRVFWLLLVAQLAMPEILDRIAVTVGYSVITEGEILRQIRLIAFQNGEKPDFSPQNKRKLADKLVEQLLVRKEIQANKYMSVESAQADKLLEATRQRFPDEAAYRKQLDEYQITEDELKEQLKWQMTLLSFIEVRFRPGIQVPEPETREYYESQYLAEWKKTNQGSPPGYDESKDIVENLIAAERADHALDRWLGQSRTQTQIRYRREVFEQ
jgi:hypothetical protein